MHNKFTDLKLKNKVLLLNGEGHELNMKSFAISC